MACEVYECGDPRARKWGQFQFCDSCIGRVRRARAERVTLAVLCGCDNGKQGDGRDCFRCHGSGTKNVVFAPRDQGDFPDYFEDRWLENSIRADEGYAPSYGATR